MDGKRTAGRGTLIVVLVIGGLYLGNTKDPLRGQGPDLMAYLAEEKTLCENRVEQLRAKGIAGEDEYEKAQAAAGACVSDLQGAVDQGDADQQAVKDRIERPQSASAAFRGWVRPAAKLWLMQGSWC